MFEIKNNQASDILEVEFIEALTEADIDHLVPVLKKHIAETDRPHMLIIMQEFAGWDKAQTFWEDAKLDTRYLNEFERVALVGDQKWEAWAIKFVNVFTPNEIRYYEPAEAIKARKWLQSE